jgi:hypothetical protein
MSRASIVKEEYQKACNEYVALFEKKHGYQFTGWVADHVGGIAEFIEQYFFSMGDITYDIDNKLKKNVIFKWQDYAVEKGMDNKPYVNLQNYSKYGEIV